MPTAPILFYVSDGGVIIEQDLRSFAGSAVSYPEGPEITALARRLRDLRARGIEPGQIAIFGRTREVVRDRSDPALAQASLTGRWLSPDSDLATNAVAIGTMHAAKGLEFRAVALVGCDAQHLPLRDALAGAVGDDARRLVEERECHLLYVGCTRARESLLITHSGWASPYLGWA
jgi:hypothetical protein